MAGASLLTLLDDITTLLDDIATLSKVAVRKTASVLSDDLALNAKQVSEVSAKRELPVVWAVAKGSALNKLIIIPLALLINAFDSRLIVLLLMIGGAYLCFEGVEKLIHSYRMKKSLKNAHEDELKSASLIRPELTSEDLVALEKTKINGAIRTDFILSAEIIVISMSVIQQHGIWIQLATLLLVAVIITGGVYGVVALIVKLDDIGYWVVKRSNEDGVSRRFGMILVNAVPYVMRLLSIVGTIAMFLVGGGIIMHNTNALQSLEHTITAAISALPAVGSILGAVTPTLGSLVIGFIVGSLAAAASALIKKIWPSQKKAASQ